MFNNIQIKTIDFGIAFRVGNVVYINSKIPEDSKLYKSLIVHELNHESGKLTLKDLKNDWLGKEINKSEYYKFLFKNKEAWIQFLPVIKLNNQLVWDYQMLGLWIFGIIVIFGGYFLGTKL